MFLAGSDPRAPHIEERREYWILKTSTGEIQELIQEHMSIFCPVEAGSMDNFQKLAAGLAVSYVPKSFHVHVMSIDSGLCQCWQLMSELNS